MIELNSKIYASENVLSEEELLLKLETLKKEGKKIGLCTGSFDLIHPGHITHLISAKKMCDVLVVAIAPDYYAATKVGRGRPVFSLPIRAFIVSKLKPVDFVIFDIYLPEPGILEIIKPDVLIKGIDYADESDPRIVKQKEIMKSLGGIISYTRDEKFSTSDVLYYIKKEIELP